MVFSKGTVKNKDFEFYYKNEILETVNEYTYLGFKITSNNKISNIMQDRIDKANRVTNVIRKCMYTTGNVNVNLALTLFDKQVVPTLLYGVAVWSVPQQTNNIYVENIPGNTSKIKEYLSEKFRIIVGKEVSVNMLKKISSNNNNYKVLVTLDNNCNKE